MADVAVVGVGTLTKNLESLTVKVQKKLSRAALGSGGKVIAKRIKAEVPSNWKAGRQAIGSRVFLDKNTGQMTVKVGVGVGLKRKKRDKLSAEAKFNRGGKKPGVGLSVNNFHWFVMGTDPRQTGQKKITTKVKGVKTVKIIQTGNVKRNTGRMKKTPIVKRGVTSSQAASTEAIRKNLQAGIEREAAKK